MRTPGAVAIVASAGGISALVDLIGCLPPDFRPPIFVAQHLPRCWSNLDAILSRASSLRTVWAAEGVHPEAGSIYLVPPGMSMRVDACGLRLLPLSPSSSSWLALGDHLFESMVAVHGARSIGVVLSGMLPVALNGMRAIKAAGGFTVAQDRITSGFFDMPAAAIDFGKADLVLRPRRIALALGVIAESWK